MFELIVRERCTGCNRCVEVCPTNVLEPGPERVPVGARVEHCQTCFMCELYCEADALYVDPDQHREPVIDPAAILASGEVGKLRHDYGWRNEGDGQGTLQHFWRLGPLLREGAEIATRRYAAAHPVPESDPAS
jgi:NAD-dependent dihydropyrimidine dehydrogenase PreA subunit